jgi:heme exporter protein B
MLNAAKFIFQTEIVLLWRRSQEWLYPLAFFCIIICLFPLAFTPDPAFLQKYMPGCIWIAALLASLLAIENIFFTEWEEGYLEQLLLSQIPLSLLMFIKLSAQWIVTQLPLIMLTPLLGFLFHLPLSATLALCASLLLGTPILTLTGSLCAALTLGLRQQGVLLGLLVFPLITPVLIFGVSIVQQSQAGLSIGGPLAFLSGLMILAMMLLPWTIAAMLRAAIDE